MVSTDLNNMYNDDELQAPAWLNAAFFTKVLENKYPHSEEIKIIKFVITPGTTKTDHYASIMFRARVDYTSKEQNSVLQKHQSMIIKTMPTSDGQKKDALGELKIYETEIRMYIETLPKIEAILQKVGDNTQLCAKALYYTLEPQKCIVFEDLVDLGYAAVSGRYCTMQEVKAAFLKLSKLHAASYKLAQEGDTSVTSYENGIFNGLDVHEFGLTKHAVRIFKEILAFHEDLRTYLPHVERIEQDILNDCVGFFTAYSRGQRDGILVLNHGDFHMKNLMVKSSSKGDSDLMLVDYQISFFGSAAIDLIYAFVMLMSPTMRHENRDELIYYYFCNFQQTLKAIGHIGHIPTMAELQTDLSKHKHWELFMVMSFLVISYEFSRVEGDLAKLIEDENYRRTTFENPALLKEIRTLMPQYLHKGFFKN